MTRRARRPSPQTRRVLRELRRAYKDDRHYWPSGRDLIKYTELHSGTLFPILTRLIADGLVDARWEEVDQDEPRARPRKRFYRLTPAGELHTRELPGVADAADVHDPDQPGPPGPAPS